MFSKYILPIEYLKYYGNEGSGPGVGFSVSCYDKEFEFNNFNSKFVQKINNQGFFDSTSNPADINGAPIKSDITKEQICKELILTEESCNFDLKNLKKIKIPYPEGEGLNYYFTYNNKTFVIEKGYYQREELIIQFNSLSPSTSAVRTSQNSSTIISSSSSATPTKTYTNPYFPNFKLVYPEDWKFTTTTTQSEVKGLLNREIVLSKNNTNLRFNFRLAPTGGGGCGIGLGIPKSTKVASFDNGLNKFILSTESVDGIQPVSHVGVANSVVYSLDKKDNNPAILCNSIDIQSNIDKSFVYEYYGRNDSTNFYENLKYVPYTLSINPTGLDFSNAIKADNPLISEIDQIISQSTFK